MMKKMINILQVVKYLNMLIGELLIVIKKSLLSRRKKISRKQLNSKI